MADDAAVTSAENDVSSTPTKRSRTSNVSRATAEGEALLKDMGFDDKETPGRRRTRAAIRGDVYTPPTKKERKAATPGSGRRGRPPKKAEEEAKNEKETVDKVEEKKKEDKKDKKDKKEEKAEEKEDDDAEEADEEEKAE